MSPGIREQHDAFPLIANNDGKMVVGQFGSFLHGFMQGYDGTIEEGDIFLTNDPYSCGGAVSHLNDWLTMMPIYRDGRLVAWAAMFGHMTDTGGKVPGSLPTDATQIFEEGIQIPPVKIFRKGELNGEMLNLLLRNCRLPHWNRSDFNAIIAALRLAERRVQEISERFGVDTFIGAMREMLDRNKVAMSAIIKMFIPEKKAYFEDYIDDDGMGMGPYKIACSLWREGDKAIFDFEGTDPQSIASVNFLLNEEMFKMFLGAFTINLFDPQILFNDGFYDLVDVRIPAAPSQPMVQAGMPEPVREIVRVEVRDPHAMSLVLDETGEMKTMDVVESEVIRFALQFYRGRMSEVSRRLGIGRSTLYRKLKDLGLDAEDKAEEAAA